MSRNTEDMDLEQVEAESDRVTNESLEATRRIRATALETREIGQQSLAALDQQGEQLRRVEHNVDGINQDAKQAERHLTQMERCCGLCLCPCTPKHNFEGSSNYSGFKSDNPEYDESGNVIVAQPGAGGQSARGAGRGQAKAGEKQYVKSITGDAREEEMNANIGFASDILGDLKAQAKAMGGELDDQNKLLDRLNDKTDSNTKRVEQASDRTTRLLRTA